MIAAIVYFFCCHGAAAPHFATFSDVLKNEGIETHIVATGEAAKYLSKAKVAYEERLDIPQDCNLLITDGGSSASEAIQKKTQAKSPHVKRAVYYENPESFVPGGYSEAMSKVIPIASYVLFANANLATDPTFPIDLAQKNVVGLGYSNLPQEVDLLRDKKKQNPRQLFFQEHGICDHGQKIVVYVGGANEVYYESAFPHFLKLIENTNRSDYLFVFQQHGRAAREGNRDRAFIQAKHPIVCSKWNFDDALSVADAVLYFQTSAAMKFVLAGIPTYQVAKEPYNDFLIRGGISLCALDQAELFSLLERPWKSVDASVVYKGLGFDPNWKKTFVNFVKECI